MVDHASQSVDPDFALADAGVAILVRAKGIHGVVEVDRLEPTETDNAVKLRQDAIKTVHDVVSAIPDMACVEAHAQWRGKRRARLRERSLRPVDDRLELAEISADLAAFSGHRL